MQIACYSSTLLCSRIRTSYSSNSLYMCFHVSVAGSIFFGLIHLLCSHLARSAMRPQQTTKLNCSGNTYHSCSLHCCLQTTTPTFMPTLLSPRPAQTLYTSLPTFVKFNLHNTYIQIASVLQYIRTHLYTCLYHCVPDSAHAILPYIYSCTAFSHQHFSHVHRCMHAAW